ncbi:MAG TPA: PEP-CTERM sorting domain-containing protein, partial [Phycisphaerae bacterium]|nr:PEP-CTERM sorting domain-containing protein [Phycisphaerae bacterium]
HANMAYLQTLTAEGTWVEEEITGIDMSGEGFRDDFQPEGPGYNWGKWFTVEVEEDNVLSKTRARIYEKGTSPGDEEGWTSWLDHHPSIHGLDYSTGGKVVVRSQGWMEYDNFSMTQESAGNPGDANNDSVVSADDYGSVQLNFGATGAVNIPGDANLDGVVSADDYGSVQLHFGTSYGAGGASVPEPATMSLLVIGGIAMLRRCSAQVLRRRRFDGAHHGRK